MHDIIHILEHVCEETLIMIPFLYLAYLLMEFIEHKSSQHMQMILTKSKKLGPILGSVLGLIPQCGFSIIASGFYMNRTITLGTLLSVFIATSDEAIPILIANVGQGKTLLQVIALKFIIAIIAGYIVDALVEHHYLKEEHSHHDIHEHCEEESKEHSIFIVALIHALKVFIFVFIANFIISLIIHGVGEDSLKYLLRDGSIIQPIIASLVGLIPNCASSVVLSSLYIDNVISFGAFFAGLVSSAGLGLLVLVKMYDNKKDLIRIIVLLVVIAIISGITLQLIGV